MDTLGVSVKYMTCESNSRDEAIDDVHDLSEVLTHWIDVLNDKNSAVKLNGNMMNPNQAIFDNYRILEQTNSK